MSDPGNTKQIQMYFHCGLCTEELKTKKLNQSPEQYARLSIGWTPKGLQVWCFRHDVNVVNIDFEGAKHPANVTADRSGK